jgi:hypothetical protein
LRFSGYALIFYLVKILETKQKTQLIRLLFLVIFAVAIFGIGQYIFLPDVTFLARLDWDDHWYRLVSTFLDPGFTGGIMVLGFVFSYLFLEKNEKFVTLGTFYAGMLLTYSRASYLMFLVSMGGISWMIKRPIVLILSIVLLFGSIQFLPRYTGESTRLGREYSIRSRINNWKQSIDVWKTSPVWGVGFNSYRYSLLEMGILDKRGVEKSHGGGADSSIFLVLATTGLVGLIAFSNLWFQILRHSKANILFLSFFFGIFVHSFFNNTLFYPFVMEIMFLVLGATEKESL